MAVRAGTSIVTDGLILNIDPANEKAVETDSLDVEYLIVAGGGGGGGAPYHGGGGGGGGVLQGYTSINSQTHSVTVGAGGINGYSSINESAQKGENSSAFGLIAIGGGGGGPYGGATGFDGGSGGGSGTRFTGSPATGIVGQGNDGGIANFTLANDDPYYGAAGGGGAGAPGQNASRYYGGNGGDGISSGISGSLKYYAGGGGGSAYATTTATGNGGLGGGGDGAYGPGGGNGEANTGGGGGGRDSRGSQNLGSGNGGSGIVIVRYKGAQKATGGDSVYQSGPYTVHVFNNSGNFVVGDAVGDVSGNNNGAAINGPVYNSGNQGYYSFDGTDDYFSVPMINLRPTSGITQECWFYTNNLNLGEVYIGAQYGTSSGNSYALWKQSDGLRSGVNLNGTFTSRVISHASSGLQAGTWNHCVATYNGSTEAMYLNGKLIGSWSRSGTLTYDTNNTLLLIGADWNGSGYDTGPTLNVNGRISAVKIYNRGLTADEVYQNFEATRGRFGV